MMSQPFRSVVAVIRVDLRLYGRCMMNDHDFHCFHNRSGRQTPIHTSL